MEVVTYMRHDWNGLIQFYKLAKNVWLEDVSNKSFRRWYLIIEKANQNIHVKTLRRDKTNFEETLKFTTYSSGKLVMKI